jgi:hypothetical protein
VRYIVKDPAPVLSPGDPIKCTVKYDPKNQVFKTSLASTVVYQPFREAESLRTEIESLRSQIENLRTLRWDDGRWGMYEAVIPGGVIDIFVHVDRSDLVVPSEDRQPFGSVEEAKAEAQRWWSEELDKAMNPAP